MRLVSWFLSDGRETVPSLTTFTYTLEDLNYTANQVKDLLAYTLKLPVLDDYLVVVQRPSHFGRFKKWLGLPIDEVKKDEIQFCVVSKHLTVEKEKEK